MKVFQFVILFDPSKKSTQGEKEKDLRKPKFLSGTETNPVETIMANDERQAAMIAARKIPEDFVTELDLIDVAVRPF